MDWEQIAALIIAISPLYGAGDLDGAAEAWTTANALAAERGLAPQPADVDDAAVAAIQAHLADALETVSAQVSGVSLADAVSSVMQRVEALTSATAP